MFGFFCNFTPAINYLNNMKQILLVIFVFFYSTIYSQETTNNDNSIKGQFLNTYKVSRTYEYYKVINIDRFKKLQKNVLDSITVKNNEIEKLQNNVADLSKKNVEIQNNNKTLLKETETLRNQNNSVNFLGATISLSTYNIILWTLILGLLIAMGYFIYKYLNNNTITKESIDNLKEVELEFEEHRKKAIEREQKLRRQLHDEVNKNRNS